jgi:uncharacterized protein
MKRIVVCCLSLVLPAFLSQGQILFSGGAYSQNFNSLATNGTANVWSDNVTLPGWYAQATNALISADYRADSGTSTTGDLYSYGSSGSPERAFGSLASGTSGNIAFGLRLQNDTGSALTDITVSYTGEQWRNGGNTNAQSLAFSYRISASPITSPDAHGTLVWTPFAPLTFTSPTVGSTATALDGNLPANRTFLSSILTDVTLNPGEELFLRWFDLNDTGNDHGLAVDDITVSATAVPEPSSMVLGLIGLGFLLARRKNR